MCFLAGSPLHVVADTGADCPDIGLPTTTVTMQLLETSEPFNMTVPVAYFDPRFVPEAGSKRSSLLLRLEAKSFDPWDNGELPTLHQGRFAQMLVSDFVALDELAQLAGGRAEGRLDPSDQRRIEEVEAMFSLKRLDAQPEEGAPAYPIDVFVARSEDGQIEDVIECDQGSPELNAICRHTIEVGIADVRVSYSHDLLHDWKDISQNAETLFSCLTRL